GRLRAVARPPADRARPDPAGERAQDPREERRALGARAPRDGKAGRPGALRDRGRGAVLRALRRARERPPRREDRPPPPPPVPHPPPAPRRRRGDPALGYS